MRVFEFNKRIGVVGMYRSGKTVFLTSLINHLSRHDPGRFPLGRGDVTLGNFKRLRARAGWREFDYEGCRSSLQAGGRWPEKSLLGGQYRCSLTRSDWPNTLLNLSFLDLAGERMADMPMAGSDYAAWSDRMVNLFSTGPEYRAHVADYLKLFDDSTPFDGSEEKILEEYRRTLARCCLAYLPVVSPSSILLGPEGDYVRTGEVEEIAAQRAVGLDRESQFAPLPREFRDRHPDLSRKFSRRYGEYRKQVVMPLARWLAECHQLVVLLDLTGLLAGGLGAYHGALHLVEDLLDWVDPGRGFLGRLFSLFLKPLSGGRLNLPGITRIAFVAIKADKVHADDRQKLLILLKDMVAARMSGLQEDLKLKVGYFICSSVKSTASLPDGFLEGRPAYRRGGESPLSRFKPSALPQSWPDDWVPGQYNFPDVLPQMPARRDLAPSHIGLNAVADFLLADNDWTE